MTEDPVDSLAGTPVDERDYTRRTLLASERTYLAWWRTGLTALTVALGAARVVPEISDADVQWPYTLVGLGFALLGTLAIAYGEHHRRQLDAAIRRGDFRAPDQTITALMSGGGVVMGIALIALILVQP